MDAPFFSIIVPVYNTEQYLKRCIDSLTGQTFSNIEIICIDDGSADNSLAILESYHDERLRIIRQDHGGVSRARNRGLEAARGGYILFADSDDYVSVDMCQGLYRIITRENPDLVVFGGQCFYHKSFRGDGGFWQGVYNAFNDVLAVRDITYSGNSIYALFHEKGAYNTVWTKCIKREILETNKIRFAESLNVAEEEPFVFAFSPVSAGYCLLPKNIIFISGTGPAQQPVFFFPITIPMNSRISGQWLRPMLFGTGWVFFPNTKRNS
jgi:glycosyltransferase involved in cell wall biosynthesis